MPDRTICPGGTKDPQPECPVLYARLGQRGPDEAPVDSPNYRPKNL